jgi:hypothetical protein
MYCIYTDAEVDEANGNYDHIVPLSLGGRDKFCIWSDEKFNSHVGSKIDGALANDALIMFARREADARGHSGTEPVPVWKKSTFEGRTVQVSLGDEVKVWDPRAKRYLDSKEFLNKPMESRWIYNHFARSKFTAKVALGAGYFVFRESFAAATDCNELRNILAADLSTFRTPLVANDPVLKGRWPPKEIVSSRLMCEFKGRTTVVVLPMASGIAFHVGVLGMYVGSIFSSGDVGKLSPEDGEVIVLGPGEMERVSLQKFGAELLDFLDKAKQAAASLSEPPSDDEPSSSA